MTSYNLYLPLQIFINEHLYRYIQYILRTLMGINEPFMWYIVYQTLYNYIVDSIAF